MTAPGDTQDGRPPLADPGAEPPEPGPHRSLLAMVALFLTVAILPVGLIAVSKVREVRERVEISQYEQIRTLTARAVQPERDAITAAFGLAKGLASAVALLDPDEARCSQIMAQSTFSIPDLLFVGFVREGGWSRCNNLGRTFDFTDQPQTRELFDNKKPKVMFTPAGGASGRAVVIVAQPVNAPDDSFLGFISLSLPVTSMAAARERHSIPDALDLVTFNDTGEVLTADMMNQPLADVLPRGLALETLGELAPKSFATETEAGERRLFLVTTIYPGRAFALASFSPERGVLTPGSPERTTIVTTLAMWLAGVVVALIGFYLLAVRPLETLGTRMRHFAGGRRVLEDVDRPSALREFETINRTFVQMARKIIRDEADLENALYEREALLREVHHRVKNNLQLISSILNMEQRQTDTPEVRQKLTRLQGRLSGLASVYRELYESETFSSVRIDRLLDALLRQLSPSSGDGADGVRISLSLDPVTLVPDQAAQLALLSVEAFSNALEHHAPDADGVNAIAVNLRDGPDDWVTLEVVNSAAAAHGTPTQVSLGARLIDAFALQLGGSAERDASPGRYSVTVRFRRAAASDDSATV
ncbi:sensor histidine kinase [Maritimibacter fusiformis]|nr:histidine kinase dimerization/phosphoacceptor domain -containing protein [Maritimibacter fusiformis]